MKPIQFLPKTSNQQLLIGIMLTAVMFVIGSGYQIYFAITHNQVFNYLISALLFVSALFLWQLKLWAQKLSKFIIGSSIVLALVGIYNPFYAMEYSHAHQGEMPNWVFISAITIPCVVVGLLCFWVLDKHKNQFH